MDRPVAQTQGLGSLLDRSGRIAELAGGEALALVLVVALVLGLRHASDPDHLAAVSTLIATDPAARLWLFTVATNLVRDRGRTTARRKRLLAAVPVAPQAGHAASMVESGRCSAAQRWGGAPP